MVKLNKYDQELLNEFMSKPGRQDCIVHVVNGTVYYMKEEEFVRLCEQVRVKDMLKGSPYGWINLDMLRFADRHGMEF